MKFKSVKEVELGYGKSNFIQVSKLELDGRYYLSITKGAYIIGEVNKKKYLKNVTFPIDADVFPQEKRDYDKLLDEVIKAIQEVK